MAKKPNTLSGRGGPPNPIDIHVGQRIRAKRRLLALGQQEFAALLGVTFQQVQKYEKGQNRISCSRLYDIAEVLETSVEFFYGDMPENVRSSSPRRLAGIKVKKGSKVKDVEASTDYMSTVAESTEIMKLVRNYNNIPKKDLKKHIFELCEILSKENVGRKPKSKELSEILSKENVGRKPKDKKD